MNELRQARRRFDPSAPSGSCLWSRCAGLYRADGAEARLGRPPEIVGARSLPVSGAQVRAWLARHDATLRAEPDAVLGRAALDALATAQPRGTTEGRDFWMNIWRNGPKAWQWRAFIGLRLQDPGTAVGEIPKLLRRLEADRIDNRPMLLGMWNQPEARPVLEEWLRTTPDQEAANKVRGALKDLASIENSATPSV